MSSILLMGPPGSGKTTMAIKTAPKRPVLAIDVDRKIRSLAWTRDMIAAGDLIVWEVAEPLIPEESLLTRANRLAKNLKPDRQPQGWIKFAELVQKLDTDPDARKCGTWLAPDSITQLAGHLKQLIMFCDDQGKSTFSDRNYGSFLQMWNETVTIMRDSAIKSNVDLIMTVHERTLEIPTENTKSTRTREGGVSRREYIGILDLKIGASLEGQFGGILPSYFEEVYGLRVDIDGQRNPKWVCRVQPDGKRDLRTSYPVKQAEFEPDFRKIWGLV